MTDDAVEELQGVVIFLMSFFFPLQVNNVCFSLQTGGMTDDAVEELQGLTKKKLLKKINRRDDGRCSRRATRSDTHEDVEH